MSTAFLRQEAILVVGAALTAVEGSLSLTVGGTVKDVAQSALPLVLAALWRSQQSPATKEDGLMADLTALKQAAVDLQNTVAAVEAHVTALKADATPQVDVDAVTAQVQQATAGLTAAAQA